MALYSQFSVNYFSGHSFISNSLISNQNSHKQSEFNLSQEKFNLMQLAQVLICLLLMSQLVSYQLLAATNEPQTYTEDTEATAGLQESLGNDSYLASQVSEIVGLFAIDPARAEFLSVSANGQVSIWSLNSSQNKVIFPAGQTITTCDFFKSAGLLAVTQDTQIYLYSLSQRKQLAISPRLGTKSSSLSFAPDGKSILAGGEDGKVYRWIFDSSANSSEAVSLRLERYIGHSAAITALAYHPYNRFFFSADSFGSVSAWQTYEKDLFTGQYDQQKITTSFYAEDGKRVLTTAAENSTILDMRISADGQNLFSSLQDGRVEWRLVRGLKLVISGKLNSGALYDIQLSPDASQFASIARDGKLRIWKMRSLDAKAAVGMKDPEVLKYNDIKSDSLGYFELIKEIELPEVRKIAFMSETSLVVGEQAGRLLEIKL